MPEDNNTIDYRLDRIYELAKQNKETIQNLERVIIGNGDYEKSILARLQHVESRLNNSSWFVDKMIIPVITAAIVAVLMWLLYGGHLSHVP